MRRFSTIAFIAVILAPALGMAQGIIIPPDRLPFHGAYAVKNITIDASVKDQVAEVRIAQVFRNLSSRDMEVSCVFPVPSDAVVNQFVLMIDGKELPAKLYTKEEAHRVYESIVRTKRDPALLEFMGYGALQTRIFPLPARAERKITLRYLQICRRDRDVSELLLPLAGGKLSSKPIEELSVNLRIESPGRIKSVYSPAYAVSVERPGDGSAVVHLAQNQISPADDLRVLWSLSDQPVGATVLSYRPSENEDGYFLLLASPEIKASEERLAAKTVVFALDHSGSMAGQKIEQARNALKFVLNNLREGDCFNIIAYDDKVESFRPELQRYSSESRAEAMRFIESIRDGGSTNIDGALRRAFELAGDTGRPTYIIFLTDGLPTAGEQNESAIALNAKNANRARGRLFAFGVGYDVNSRLLDRLTTENSGSSEYVRPNENIELAVGKFYSRMSAPVLTALRLAMPGAEVNRLYPAELPDLFAGGQMIVAGRYRTSGAASIMLTGRVADAERTFTFPAALAAHSADDTYAFVEKLWVSRRIGEIINELDLHGRNQELIDELVRLSTRHGILTPYTAFLADERTNLQAGAANSREAERRIFLDREGIAQNTTGAAGFNLRAAKAMLQQQAQATTGTLNFDNGYAGGRFVNGGYMDFNGNMQTEQRVQLVGNNALYRRQSRWIDPTITPEEERKSVQVEQFSEKYFELARANARLRQYLAVPEGCTVRVDGTVYQINPAQNGAKG